MDPNASSHPPLNDFSRWLSLCNLGTDPIENTASNDAINCCICIHCQGYVFIGRYLATGVYSLSTILIFQLLRHSIVEWRVETDILTPFSNNNTQVNHKSPPLYRIRYFTYPHQHIVTHRTDTILLKKNTSRSFMQIINTRQFIPKVAQNFAMTISNLKPINKGEICVCLIYRMSQEERSIFWEVIVSAILSKKCIYIYIYTCVLYRTVSEISYFSVQFQNCW
jgi:hypothetical protein